MGSLPSMDSCCIKSDKNAEGCDVNNLENDTNLNYTIQNQNLVVLETDEGKMKKHTTILSQKIKKKDYYLLSIKASTSNPNLQTNQLSKCNTSFLSPQNNKDGYISNKRKELNLIQSILSKTLNFQNAKQRLSPLPNSKQDDSMKCLNPGWIENSSYSSSSKENEGICKMQLSENDALFLNSILLKVFPNLENDEILEAIQALIHCIIDKDKVIAEHSDNFNCLFIIKQGKVGLFHDKVLIDMYTTGDYFGDVAFIKTSVNQLEKCPNGWSYRCICPTELYLISSQHIRWIHSQFLQKKYDLFYLIAGSIPFISALDEMNKKALSESFIYIEIKKGMVLQPESSYPEDIYYIKEGQLIQIQNNKTIAEYTQGQSINYELLIVSEMNKQSLIQVKSNTASVIIVSRQNLKKFFGDQYTNSFLFACFFKSLSLNKEIFRLLDNYAKANVEIQRKVNEFHSSNENNVVKKRLSSLCKKAGNIELIKTESSPQTIYKQALKEFNPSNSNSILSHLLLDHKESMIKSVRNEESTRKNCIYQPNSSQQIEMKQLFKKFWLNCYPEGTLLNIKNDQFFILIHGTMIENNCLQNEVQEYNFISPNLTR